MHPALKWLHYLISSIVILVTLVGLIGYFAVQGSEPKLQGEFSSSFISSDIHIDRDNRGFPSITANSKSDAAFGLGYIHAQERFFQMDQYRRFAAGELSELLGPAAIESDRMNRIFRYRARAREILLKLTPQELELLQSYTLGINEGLAHLTVRPFEYILLGKTPVAWGAEDSILAQFAFFLYLQDSRGTREISLDILKENLSEQWFTFLASNGGDWDSPMSGQKFTNAPIPNESWPDQISKSFDQSLFNPPIPVSSRLYAANINNSPAIFNEYNFELEVPLLWFVAEWQYQDKKVKGLTIPGIPLMLAGSNGQISWGISNSKGDWSDLVMLSTNPSSSLYETADGWENFQIYQEQIRIKGGDPENIEIKETKWGPVIGESNDGTLLALKWVALEPEGINFQLSNLEQVNTVDQALTVAANSRMAEQDFMVIDLNGNLGWTILGAIPNRTGLNGQFPNNWIDRSTNWDGMLADKSYPSIRSNTDRTLWVANNRVVSGSDLRKIGIGNYHLGDRAKQLSQLADLTYDKPITSKILGQLENTRPLFLEPWYQILSDSLTNSSLAEEDKRTTLSQLESWNSEYPSNDTIKFIQSFRAHIIGQSIGKIFQGIAERHTQFKPYAISSNIEYPALALIQEQPEHLIPANYISWSQLIQHAIERALTENKVQIKSNKYEYKHPLAGLYPGLENLLNFEMERNIAGEFQSDLSTAQLDHSYQFALSAHDQDLINIPLSQSGHPLSPYYKTNHLYWISNEQQNFSSNTPNWQLKIKAE